MSGVLKLANILLFITSLLTSFHSFRPASLLLKEYFALFSLTPFRPRLIATPPYGATLAVWSWASHVQARRHGVQLPARSSASVPRGIVPTGPRCRIGQLSGSGYWREQFQTIFELKTFLFATYWCIQRIRGFTTMRYINRLFTYFYLEFGLEFTLRFRVKVRCSWGGCLQEGASPVEARQISVRSRQKP